MRPSKNNGQKKKKRKKGINKAKNDTNEREEFVNVTKKEECERSEKSIHRSGKGRSKGGRGKCSVSSEGGKGKGGLGKPLQRRSRSLQRFPLQTSDGATTTTLLVYSAVSTLKQEKWYFLNGKKGR